MWKLIPAPAYSGAIAWLAVKRFDWVGYSSSDTMAHGDPGKLHMHSACGLLDADFRVPCVDYLELIKASRQLCKSPKIDTECEFGNKTDNRCSHSML